MFVLNLSFIQKIFYENIFNFKFWKIIRQKILFSRHLAGGDWVKAESALATLSALHYNLEVMLWKAELNFRLGDMEVTRSILTDIIDHFEKVFLISKLVLLYNFYLML